MKNKIKITLITFILAIFAILPVSNAQTMGYFARLATSDLNAFFSAPVGSITNGNTDVPIKSSHYYAYYCMDPKFHSTANHTNMRTAVVDVGANGISSVNGLSTANSVGARYAMQVLYYAARSYELREPWGRTGNSPYRLMMMQTSAKYAGTMVNSGLFNSSLPGGVDDAYMKNQFGSAKYNRLNTEGLNYVASTTNYAFKDQSTKNIQTIEENGDWVFVGPYKIQNSGLGYISDITVTTMDGRICRPDGWSKSVNANAVNKNLQLPNGETFYLAFKNQKPDSAEKVVVKKRSDGVVRARMVFFGSDGGQNMAVYGGKTTDSSINSINLPKVPFSNIKITKIDKDSKKGLKNVGFLVYHVETDSWLADGVPAKYVTKDKATMYKTGADGKVTIRNLNKKGTYKIYEVLNPNFGYIDTSIENPCQEINVSISAIGQAASKVVENKRLYIKLSGYAWEDIASNKVSQRNNLYGQQEKDQRLRNITVTLKKVNGEILDTRVTNTITNTKNQTEKGAYLFGDYQRDKNAKKIKIEDLRGAYIEFEYNGMCYKSVPINLKEDAGSKATDDYLREVFNQNYSTITKGKAQNGDYNLNYKYENHKAILQYGGNYLYGYHREIYKDDDSIQKYPISGIDGQYLLKASTLEAEPKNFLGQGKYTIDDVYKQGIEEVPNINLGLYEREMPDISLVQDISNAKISLNGYEHTYNYADRFSQLNQQIEEFKNQHQNDGEIFNIGVNFGTKYGPNSYTRTVYSSDVVYDELAEKGSLKVKIQYQIALRNETGSVMTTVNEIYNYFDKDYRIEKDLLKVQDENGKELEWTLDENYQEQGRRRILIHPQGGIAINKNSTRYLTITYEVADEAVVRLLNEEKTVDSITEIVSYSSYDENNQPYAGVDQDSEPNNSTIENKDTYEDDIDQAPSLILKSDATRSIHGTVWQEDAISALLEENVKGFDRQRIGNGQYDAEIEKVLKDVQVELLKIEEKDGVTTYIPATLYQTVKEGENNQDKVVETETNKIKTNEFGDYSFVGVIPGKYKIKFTYGNESVICNIEGVPEQTLKEAEGGVEYYKSTLYRTKRNEDGSLDSTAYDKLKSEKNLHWYSDETKDASRLSDARDDEALVEQRTSVEEINHTTAVETSNITEISSNTSPLEIRMDCNADDLENVSKYGQTLKYVFDNIDFGIIRRPKQDLIIRKEVAYIEVTLANGQIVIKGDPRKEKLQNVKFLPNGNVHIELDNEIMQGATLKVKYEITVDNTKCEIDYNDSNYYYFGKITKPESWEIATITDLFDYPNSGLNFDENNPENSIWEHIKLNDIDTNRLSEAARKALSKYSVILHTTAFKDMKPGEIKTQYMTLTRLLANVNDDFSFDNEVEINTYDGRKTDYTIPGNYDPSDSTTGENDNDGKNIVITGPTGENQQILPYILLGITSLLTLVVGVVLIKKVVKNKRR